MQTNENLTATADSMSTAHLMEALLMTESPRVQKFLARKLAERADFRQGWTEAA